MLQPCGNLEPPVRECANPDKRPSGDPKPERRLASGGWRPDRGPLSMSVPEPQRKRHCRFVLQRNPGAGQSRATSPNLQVCSIERGGLIVVVVDDEAT